MTDSVALGTIGSIGLGDMGYGIAMNIAKLGSQNTLAFDLRPRGRTTCATGVVAGQVEGPDSWSTPTS